MVNEHVFCFMFFIIKNNLLIAIYPPPPQYLYNLSKIAGFFFLQVDFPRNLAKSVTVE